MAVAAAAAALLIPRWMCTGFAPDETYRRPAVRIAWASTVAAVVPSPAMSAVFFATSLTILAPMDSKGSGSVISLATLTPSLVTVGPPHDFWMTTCRPDGPMVHLTASAS